MDSAYLQERITVTKTIIEAFEDAILALTIGQMTQYTMDTGQSRVVVTRADLVRLNAGLDGLYNRLCTMQARLDGSGSVTVRPGW